MIATGFDLKAGAAHAPELQHVSQDALFAGLRLALIGYCPAALVCASLRSIQRLLSAPTAAKITACSVHQAIGIFSTAWAYRSAL